MLILIEQSAAKEEPPVERYIGLSTPAIDLAKERILRIVPQHAEDRSHVQLQCTKESTNNAGYP